MDELLKTIETIRDRAERHRDHLETGKLRTRMALVEPVLRTLGWDTGNPLEVQPEYTLTGGNGQTHQADLMLFMGTAGRWAAVDVIPLGHEPHPEEMGHLVELCRETQTPSATVTNGTS